MHNSVIMRIALYALFFTIVMIMTLATALAMLGFIPFVAGKALWTLLSYQCKSSPDKS